MALTPERKAEVEALLDDILGPEPTARPKPKVVADAGVVVRDADVVVSPVDPNARARAATGVRVRRQPPAESPMASMLRREVERRYWEREADRQRHRMLDPFGLGHWGPRDE
jgi:hypothetical protein